MSESYFDIKITSGIEPKGEDSDFPILKSHHVETAENQRLDDKLVGIDNQFALDNQKIDAESARLDGRITTTAEELNNKIDANRNEVDDDISAINEHLTQTDANLAQEVTDRVNFGHAVNNEFAKVNSQLEIITENTSGVNNKIESVKVECKNYTDNKVTVEELARQQAVSNEASARSVADSNLQAQLNNKVSVETYNNDKAVTDESIRNLNNKITAIPSTYATKAEVDGVKSEFQGKLDNKLDKVTFDAYKSEAENKLQETNATVSSLQQTVSGIAQDYLKASDKAELQAGIATVEGKIDESIAEVVANVEELSNVVTGNKEAVDIALEGKLDKSTYESEKVEFALKSEIPSIDNLATRNEVASAVEAVESNLDAVESNLSDAVATKVDTITFNNTTATLETKINTARNQAVDTAVGTLEPLIQSNTSAIANKVDLEALENYALKSDLTAKQDAVVFTSDAVTSVEVGSLSSGSNLKDMKLADILKAILGVSIGVSSIHLSQTAVNLMINKSVELTATVLPADATTKTITWSVDNSNVTLSATEGTTIVVTAVASGATATVTAECSGKTAQCAVSVVSELTPSETIISEEIPMYVTDLSGNLVEVPFSMIEIAEADRNKDAVASGFYQITGESGNIIEEGYQSILPIYQDGPLTIALPNILSLNDVTLYQYDALQSKWSNRDASFLTESATQNISEYTIYEDSNNASQGEHFRFAIKIRG